MPTTHILQSEYERTIRETFVTAGGPTKLLKTWILHTLLLRVGISSWEIRSTKVTSERQERLGLLGGSILRNSMAQTFQLFAKIISGERDSVHVLEATAKSQAAPSLDFWTSALETSHTGLLDDLKQVCLSLDIRPQPLDPAYVQFACSVSAVDLAEIANSVQQDFYSDMLSPNAVYSYYHSSNELAQELNRIALGFSDSCAQLAQTWIQEVSDWLRANCHRLTEDWDDSFGSSRATPTEASQLAPSPATLRLLEYNFKAANFVAGARDQAIFASKRMQEPLFLNRLPLIHPQTFLMLLESHEKFIPNRSGGNDPAQFLLNPEMCNEAYWYYTRRLNEFREKEVILAAQHEIWDACHVIRDRMFAVGARMNYVPHPLPLYAKHDTVMSLYYHGELEALKERVEQCDARSTIVEFFSRVGHTNTTVLQYIITNYFRYTKIATDWQTSAVMGLMIEKCHKALFEDFSQVNGSTRFSAEPSQFHASFKLAELRDTFRIYWGYACFAAHVNQCVTPLLEIVQKQSLWRLPMNDATSRQAEQLYFLCLQLGDELPSTAQTVQIYKLKPTREQLHKRSYHPSNRPVGREESDMVWKILEWAAHLDAKIDATRSLSEAEKQARRILLLILAHNPWIANKIIADLAQPNWYASGEDWLANKLIFQNKMQKLTWLAHIGHEKVAELVRASSSPARAATRVIINEENRTHFCEFILFAARPDVFAETEADTVAALQLFMREFLADAHLASYLAKRVESTITSVRDLVAMNFNQYWQIGGSLLPFNTPQIVPVALTYGELLFTLLSVADQIDQRVNNVSLLGESICSVLYYVFLHNQKLLARFFAEYTTDQTTFSGTDWRQFLQILRRHGQSRTPKTGLLLQFNALPELFAQENVNIDFAVGILDLMADVMQSHPEIKAAVGDGLVAQLRPLWRRIDDPTICHPGQPPLWFQWHCGNVSDHTFQAVLDLLFKTGFLFDFFQETQLLEISMKRLLDAAPSPQSHAYSRSHSQLTIIFLWLEKIQINVAIALIEGPVKKILDDILKKIVLNIRDSTSTPVVYRPVMNVLDAVLRMLRRVAETERRAYDRNAQSSEPTDTSVPATAISGTSMPTIEASGATVSPTEVTSHFESQMMNSVIEIIYSYGDTGANTEIDNRVLFFLWDRFFAIWVNEPRKKSNADNFHGLLRIRASLFHCFYRNSALLNGFHIESLLSALHNQGLMIEFYAGRQPVLMGSDPMRVRIDETPALHWALNQRAWGLFGDLINFLNELKQMPPVFYDYMDDLAACPQAPEACWIYNGKTAQWEPRSPAAVTRCDIRTIIVQPDMHGNNAIHHALESLPSHVSFDSQVRPLRAAADIIHDLKRCTWTIGKMLEILLLLHDGNAHRPYWENHEICVDLHPHLRPHSSVTITAESADAGAVYPNAGPDILITLFKLMLGHAHLMAGDPEDRLREARSVLGVELQNLFDNTFRLVATNPQEHRQLGRLLVHALRSDPEWVRNLDGQMACDAFDSFKKWQDFFKQFIDRDALKKWRKTHKKETQGVSDADLSYFNDMQELFPHCSLLFFRNALGEYEERVGTRTHLESVRRWYDSLSQLIHKKGLPGQFLAFAWALFGHDPSLNPTGHMSRLLQRFVPRANSLESCFAACQESGLLGNYYFAEIVWNAMDPNAQSNDACKKFCVDSRTIIRRTFLAQSDEECIENDRRMVYALSRQPSPANIPSSFINSLAMIITKIKTEQQPRFFWFTLDFLERDLCRFLRNHSEKQSTISHYVKKIIDVLKEYLSVPRSGGAVSSVHDQDRQAYVLGAIGCILEHINKHQKSESTLHLELSIILEMYPILNQADKIAESLDPFKIHRVEAVVHDTKPDDPDSDVTPVVSTIFFTQEPVVPSNRDWYERNSSNEECQFFKL